MTFQVVILAAGKGTRLGAKDTPKVLYTVGGKPLLAYLLESIKRVPKLGKPIVVVGYQDEKVRQAFGDACIYVKQEEQKGTAHALLSAKQAVYADAVLVLYGDAPFIRENSISALINIHKKNNSTVSLVTSLVPNFESEYASFNNYGRVLRQQDGNIIKLIEYPDASAEVRLVREVNTGMYAFNASWLWNNLGQLSTNNSKGEFYLTDMVELAVCQGILISSIKISPMEALGINTPEDLALAESLQESGVLS